MGGVTYVVYKGDDVIATGTADECAKLLGVKPRTVRWYASPSAGRRSERGPNRTWAVTVRIP